MGYCCRIFTPVQPVYPAASRGIFSLVLSAPVAFMSISRRMMRSVQLTNSGARGALTAKNSRQRGW
jgi:hypothetical protein